MTNPLRGVIIAWQPPEKRACSAVGSAPHSHCGGRGFESLQVHQEKSTLRRAFFNEINPCGICEMPFGREIWLAPCEMPAGVGDLFHFNFRVSGRFHNDRRSLFHILRIFHCAFLLFRCIISLINLNLPNRTVTLLMVVFTPTYTPFGRSLA